MTRPKVKVLTYLAKTSSKYSKEISQVIELKTLHHGTIHVLRGALTERDMMFLATSAQFIEVVYVDGVPQCQKMIHCTSGIGYKLFI